MHVSPLESTVSLILPECRPAMRAFFRFRWRPDHFDLSGLAMIGQQGFWPEPDVVRIRPKDGMTRARFLRLNVGDGQHFHGKRFGINQGGPAVGVCQEDSGPDFASNAAENLKAARVWQALELARFLVENCLPGP